MPPSSCYRRRLQPEQPILLLYSRNEVFGEVAEILPTRYRIRLYGENGPAGSILLAKRGVAWRDLTHQVTLEVVEELSGPQISQFMLYRDYSAWKGLRASA